MDTIVTGKQSERKLLVIINVDGGSCNSRMFTACINVFENFVQNVKLKNARRCNICQNKKKCFRSCFQCNDKYCIECYNNIHKTSMKCCPYCRYSFKEHIENSLKKKRGENKLDLKW